MKHEFPGIILSDKLFSIEDLIPYCKSKLLEAELPEWEAKIHQFLIDFLDDKDYIEQNSSGTTGKPKTFKLSKRAMVESAKMTVKKLNLKYSDRALLCLPVEYIAGKMMIVRSFVTGLNLFWEEPTSMPSLAKYGKMDFCAMVPLQVYNSFSNYEFFKNIRNLIIGGSELRKEVLAMFKDVQNNTFETYGMAETCSHIALRKINGPNPDKYFEVLPGIEILVDDRSCLKIIAPFLELPVQTNDVVEIIDKKHFIWKSRIDNLINSGGIKINPEELEASISKIIDVECAVIGVKDPKLGQKIVLIVEAEKNIDKDEMMRNLKDSLQVYQVPREIIIVEEIPRNNSFKIDRLKLDKFISKEN
jgi:O-succinylbenzoic acid--CoA ligase